MSLNDCSVEDMIKWRDTAIARIKDRQELCDIHLKQEIAAKKQRAKCLKRIEKDSRWIRAINRNLTKRIVKSADVIRNAPKIHPQLKIDPAPKSFRNQLSDTWNMKRTGMESLIPLFKRLEKSGILRIPDGRFGR